jgi:ferritin-like metal-binding protein YciE
MIEVVALLEGTLEEEKAADTKLIEVTQALVVVGGEEDADEGK